MAEETYSLLTNDPDVQKSIQILSGVRDEELEWLYQNCIFTIFPSMYEGWGLPVAESLSHGKVCISSDVSSMPEVGGDLVSYISPYNPAEAIEKIKNLCNDKTRRELEERIRAHYKPVTWQDTYESFRKEVKILS